MVENSLGQLWLDNKNNVIIDNWNYYIKPVIGEDEIKSNGYIQVGFDKNSNIIWAKNLYNTSDLDVKNQIYTSCSEKITSFTGDKNFFLGDGGISNPQGLKKIVLESFANKEISIILGAEENLMDCKNIAYKYSKINNCRQELNRVKAHWRELLRKIASIYTFRVNKYHSKWLDCLSNN